MKNQFLTSYLAELRSVVKRFPSDLMGFAAQAAMQTLLDNWDDAAADAQDTKVFGIDNMSADLATVIEMLEHFQRNLHECAYADRFGEEIAPPKKVVYPLKRSLGLDVPKPDTQLPDEGVVIGAFYEMPDGVIAKTTGSIAHFEIVNYALDDDQSEARVVTYADFSKWVRRNDLRDYPNARDPRLPYEFDLHWDIKYLSELAPFLAHASSKEAQEARALMAQHNIAEPVYYDGWFDVDAYATKEDYEAGHSTDTLDGFETLEGAKEYAHLEQYAGCFRVNVVALGAHREHEPGEVVYSTGPGATLDSQSQG